MKVLILTCRFGMGHNTVANVISNKLNKQGYETKIVDIIDYIYPILSKFVYKIFSFMVKYAPKFYNFTCKSYSGNKPPFRRFALFKMKKLYSTFPADIVVCTFPVCSSYSAILKSKANKNFKLYTYITDIYPDIEWINDYTDKYFVASKKTKTVLKEHNIDDKKIIITGIPVKEEFKETSKKNKDKNVLILGGGLGIIPSIEDIINQLSKNNVKITIVVGKNKSLLKKLKNKYSNIEILGYTNELYKYMKQASLVITKAGGITIFEAIHSQTPLCVIKPFLKQEFENANYVIDNNIGIVIDFKKRDFVNEIKVLINDDKKLNQMKNNMQDIASKLRLDNCEKYY